MFIVWHGTTGAYSITLTPTLSLKGEGALVAFAYPC